VRAGQRQREDEGAGREVAADTIARSSAEGIGWLRLGWENPANPNAGPNV